MNFAYSSDTEFSKKYLRSSQIVVIVIFFFALYNIVVVAESEYRPRVELKFGDKTYNTALYLLHYAEVAKRIGHTCIRRQYFEIYWACCATHFSPVEEDVDFFGKRTVMHEKQSPSIAALVGSCRGSFG